MQKKSLVTQNWLLAIAVITLAIIPLAFVQGKFEGSDDQAEGAIQSLNADYKPWFHHLFEPPSTEVESLLFASQAAMGAGVIGYVLGLYRGRSERQKTENEITSPKER